MVYFVFSMKFCREREREREIEREMGVFHHCMQITYICKLQNYDCKYEYILPYTWFFFNLIIMLLWVKFGWDCGSLFSLWILSICCFIFKNLHPFARSYFFYPYKNPNTMQVIKHCLAQDCVLVHCTMRYRYDEKWNFSTNIVANIIDCGHMAKSKRGSFKILSKCNVKFPTSVQKDC